MTPPLHQFDNTACLVLKSKTLLRIYTQQTSHLVSGVINIIV